jgi:hypothetical protein
MKILLFANDVVAVWTAQLTVVSLPAIVVGAAIGFTIRRWIACLVISYAAALGLVYSVPQFHPFHRPLSAVELIVWSAALALPAILAPTSLGYFVARWVRTRRAKPGTV